MPTEKGKWALAKKLPEESLAELVQRLNTIKEVKNSNKQQKVLGPIDMKAVRALVTDEEAFTVLNSNIWGLTLQALAKGDFQGVSDNIKAMVAGKILTAASAAKIAEVLKPNVPDPTYQDILKTSDCNLAGYTTLTLEDLQ